MPTAYRNLFGEKPRTPVGLPRIVIPRKLGPLTGRRMAIRPENHPRIWIGNVERLLPHRLKAVHRGRLRIGHDPVHHLLPIHIRAMLDIAADAVADRLAHGAEDMKD